LRTIGVEWVCAVIPLARGPAALGFRRPKDPMAPERILIVDGEVNASSALRSMLVDEGFDVREAGDGQEGLELLEQFAPAAVLTDVKMPRMDGIALLRAARERGSDAIFIVMTAFASIESAAEAMRAGAEGYVLKPLNIDVALITLQKALEKRAQQLESQALRQCIRERQEALRISQETFAGIISIAADAIITIDEQHRITLFNQGAEQIFGYSQKEALGAPLNLLLPDSFRAVHSKQVEGFAAGSATSRRMAEHRPIFARRKNGEVFPAEAAISKHKVGGGWMFTAVLRDVTDHKRIEREQQFLAEAGTALASSLNYQETLSCVSRLAVRSLADCCIIDIIDEQGQVRCLQVAIANPALTSLEQELRQYPLLPGMRSVFENGLFDTGKAELRSDLPPDFLESVAQDREHLRILRQLGPRSFVTVPLSARRRLLGAIIFISTESGREYGSNDVRMAEELARRAALAIDNAQLYERAQRATRAREDLLAVVSHDLKNPLSVILMNLGMLLTPSESSESEDRRRSRQKLTTIKRSADRMTHLINDLLDMTSIEAGRLSVELTPLAAAPLVSAALEELSPLAATKSLRLASKLPADLPAIFADAARLQQVLANLLGNAIKFTPEGGTITVHAEPCGDAVRFFVADTGSGIAQEDLTFIFDRFWQAQRTARLGTGLGLFIVRGIVEAHGGKVWVESKAGVGTTFFFTLPVAQPVDEPPPIAA
jgi:PAS domain S-box-containing protein